MTPMQESYRGLVRFEQLMQISLQIGSRRAPEGEGASGAKARLVPAV
jgi:hypothetical protein